MKTWKVNIKLTGIDILVVADTEGEAIDTAQEKLILLLAHGNGFHKYSYAEVEEVET